MAACQHSTSHNTSTACHTSTAYHAPNAAWHDALQVARKAAQRRAQVGQVEVKTPHPGAQLVQLLVGLPGLVLHIAQVALQLPYTAPVNLNVQVNGAVCLHALAPDALKVVQQLPNIVLAPVLRFDDGNEMVNHSSHVRYL